jgi:hypothetical protein
MTPQELEQKVIEYMTTKTPMDAIIKDRHITYHSAIVTHRSYANQLMSAQRDTGIYRTYLTRCYHWLILLKKTDIDLQDIIKD